MRNRAILAMVTFMGKAPTLPLSSGPNPSPPKRLLPLISRFSPFLAFPESRKAVVEEKKSRTCEVLLLTIASEISRLGWKVTAWRVTYWQLNTLGSVSLSACCHCFELMVEACHAREVSTIENPLNFRFLASQHHDSGTTGEACSGGRS